MSVSCGVMYDDEAAASTSTNTKTLPSHMGPHDGVFTCIPFLLLNTLSIHIVEHNMDMIKDGRWDK